MGNETRSLGMRQIALVLIVTYAVVLLSFVLPQIPLDGRIADLAVLLADSATARQLPWLAVAALIVVVTRPGIPTQRRIREGGAIVVIMLVILAGNAALNESTIKPSFAVPRPNLTALADHGALGIGVEEFYALGDKQIRREYLAPRLAGLDDPWLNVAVYDHWLEELGYSFPSGHATVSMTFATLMLAIGLTWAQGWRRFALLLIPVWAVLVGFSRPLLRVHSPVDVSVGALLGIGLGLAGFAVLRRLMEVKEHRPRIQGWHGRL